MRSVLRYSRCNSIEEREIFKSLTEIIGYAEDPEASGGQVGAERGRDL